MYMRMSTERKVISHIKCMNYEQLHKYCDDDDDDKKGGKSDITEYKQNDK